MTVGALVRRVSVLAVVVGLAALPAVGGATTQATKEVRITDTAVDPFQVDIAVGDSVRWRNRGSRRHAVASDSGAWAPFVLTPGRTKTIRFRKAGCFNYKVDGRIRGRVAVAASCSGGGQGGGPVTYRYDITVTGLARTTQRHSGDEPGIYDNNGTVDLNLTWKSTYRNVAVKKVSSGPDAFIISNATSSFARGTTELTFAYDHARTNNLGPCQGRFTLENLASVVRVAGLRIGLGNEFSFGSQMALGPSKTFADRIESSCPDYSDAPRWIEFQGAPEPDIVRGGLTWEDVDPIIVLNVNVERKASRSFSPLTRLAVGGGFTIQTGAIGNQGPCHFGTLARNCTETFAGALTVKFVSRPR